MNEIAKAYLGKSHKLLRDAETMLGAGLIEAAGRNAYLASFHAALAFIAASGERVPKTHQGVHNRFFTLTKDNEDIAPELRVVLSKTYRLKAIADYETGADAEIPFEQAELAAGSARDFVQRIEAVLGLRDG